MKKYENDRAKTVDEFLEELLASAFFRESCSLTREQSETGAGRECLMVAMMLLDEKYSKKLVQQDITKDNVAEYEKSIQSNCTGKQKNLLLSAVQYVSAAFLEKNKYLDKNSIPILLYLADEAEDAGIYPVCFEEWWQKFTEETVIFQRYRRFCGQEDAGWEYVAERMKIMTSSFYSYFSGCE